MGKDRKGRQRGWCECTCCWSACLSSCRCSCWHPPGPPVH